MSSSRRKAAWKEQAQAKTAYALATMEREVESILDSDRYKQALRFRARLHDYSFGNVLLLLSQKPDVTMVAGYKRWQELGRQVRKGEKSLVVLAPLVGKNEDGEPTVFGFKTSAVFDVSQTDGEEVPTFQAPTILADESEQTARLFEAALGVAAARGYKVEVVDDLSGAQGAIALSSGSIKLLKAPTAQLLKTLVHEMAHGEMHRGDSADAETQELEAETCAFLTCDLLGLDTSSYSFPYLSSWAENKEKLKEFVKATERACKTALALAEAVREVAL